MKRRASNSGEWPAFDAPLLQEIAAAFHNRRKALRYQAGLSCSRGFSEPYCRACASRPETLERLDLNLQRGYMRLTVWANGGMWFLVCVRGTGRNSGWAFKDSFYAEVLDVSGQALVAMLEATLALSFGFGTDPLREREQLREIWRRVRPYQG